MTGSPRHGTWRPARLREGKGTWSLKRPGARMTRSFGSRPTLAQSDWNEFAGGFRFPLRTILSFELALVLLISVGAWKANPAFAWMFPVDTTLIMVAVCGAGISK